MYALLIRLKLAELRSVKENFISPTPILAVTDPIRVKENTAWVKVSGLLSTKRRVVQVFYPERITRHMIDLLARAEPPMDDASEILARRNSAALPSSRRP